MTDAIGQLERRRLRFPKMTFDVIHRVSIKHQAPDALFSLETAEKDQTPLEDDLQNVLMVNKELIPYAIEIHDGWSEELSEHLWRERDCII